MINILPIVFLFLTLVSCAGSKPVEVNNSVNGRSEKAVKPEPPMIENPDGFCDTAVNTSLKFIKQGFLSFHYTEAIIWMYTLRYAAKTGDRKLLNEIVAGYDLDQRYKEILLNKNHVDYSVFGIIPLEIYLQTGDERFLKEGMEFADRQWDAPRADGLSGQTRFWIDDMYMITVLQVQAFRASGDLVYLDRAALEMSAYLGKLQQDNGLFFHAPSARYFWGRGNGWVAAGITELLLELNPSSGYYRSVLEAYRKMMTALAGFQDGDGLWHQLIDHPESFQEGSCSAMFCYALVTGVKEGWLDSEIFSKTAEKAWKGIQGFTTAVGKLKNVCVGTGRGANLQYYLDRPRQDGDPHGQAALLWVIDAADYAE